MSQRIVVLNPKGGSGKTTVAINLLAAYAHGGRKAALIDRDRQGSASRWLKLRPDKLPAIHGIAAFEEPPANVTRSFAMRVPQDVERVVVDTPAAMTRHEIIDVVRNADKILVPVLPSDIDIHAATRCISELLVHARVPRGNAVLAVVANRVKRHTLMYQSLMRFLDSLGVPVVAVLRDVQVYVRAAEAGLGVTELRPAEAGEELPQWDGLLQWLDRDIVPVGAISRSRTPITPSTTAPITASITAPITDPITDPIVNPEREPSRLRARLIARPSDREPV